MAGWLIGPPGGATCGLMAEAFAAPDRMVAACTTLSGGPQPAGGGRISRGSRINLFPVIIVSSDEGRRALAPAVVCYAVTVPLPARTITSHSGGLVMGGVQGIDWTSSAVTVILKLPVMLRYAPVPDPVTMGTVLAKLAK
jgi:hypothetical protein